MTDVKGFAPSHPRARIDRPARPWLAGLTLLSLAVPFAPRAEVQVSGFGTLGAAVSDQDFIYQRYIDDNGTLNRDSLAGLQLDARLTDAWSVTLQAKAAPSTHSDTGWEPTLSWAFLSWRPDNDLLLRAGKLRLPLMLYSANSDVGTTFEFARLPTEVYSLMPTTDLNGLSFSKTWLNDEREWTLEGYLGRAHADWRYYLRDGLEPIFPAGPMFLGYDLDMAGLVLSLRDHENVWRIGLHRTNAEWDVWPGPHANFLLSPSHPASATTRSRTTCRGRGFPYLDKYIIYILTLGAEIALPNDFRLVGEYGRRRFTNATAGPDTNAAYLALLKQIGHWTPYIYWAGIRTQGKALDYIDSLNNNRVPGFIPGADQINATQRAGADLLSPYDQHSWAIGTSYSLSPTSKLKAEWLHTQTGSVSSFVNSPANEDSGGRQINVFSLSYSFTF